MQSNRYSWQILIKLQFSWQINEKSSNIKFYANAASGSQVVPCRQTDMRKLKVAFHNVMNVPNKNMHIVCLFTYIFLTITIHIN